VKATSLPQGGYHLGITKRKHMYATAKDVAREAAGSGVGAGAGAAVGAGGSGSASGSGTMHPGMVTRSLPPLAEETSAFLCAFPRACVPFCVRAFLCAFPRAASHGLGMKE
jgi:hypothetical protein